MGTKCFPAPTLTGCRRGHWKEGGSTENGRWKPKQGGGCLPGPQVLGCL